MLVYIIYKYIRVFKQILHRFHLSQVSVPRKGNQPSHHRPLTLLLLLIIVSQQFGIFSSFADSLSGTTPYVTPPKTYIYVRTNPLIDDSWIGTLVSFTKKLPVNNILTGSNTNIISTNVTSTLFNTHTTWTEDWQEYINTIDGNQSNTEFNSAPLLSSMQGAFSSIFSTIFERLTTDETNINILSKSLGKTNTSLISLSGSFSTLNSNLTTTNSDLSALSGALAAANTRINSIG